MILPVVEMILDLMSGGSGNDDLSGDNGSDVVAGNAGDDLMNGGNSADALIDGLGSDIANGGNGDDLFFAIQPLLLGSTTADVDVFNGGGGFDTVVVQIAPTSWRPSRPTCRTSRPGNRSSSHP